MIPQEPLNSPSPPPPPRQGLVASIIKPWLQGSLKGYWTFLLLLFLLLTVTLSLENARWAPSMPSLIPVLLLAMVTGRIMAPRSWPQARHHLLALGLGGVMTLLQLGRMASSQGGGFLYAFSGIGSWLQAALTGGSNQGALAFASFLIALTWGLGYLSAWLIFRGHLPWQIILPSGIVLLINLANLPQEFQAYFFFFLLAACLLLAYSHFLRHLREWSRQEPARMETTYPLLYAFGLSLAAIAFAWLLPQAPSSPNLVAKAQRPWEMAQDRLERLFTSLTIKKPFHYIGGEGSLDFGSQPFELGETPLFLVAADMPHLWFSRSYDIYTSQGWDSSPTVQLPLNQEEAAPSRSELHTATITMQVYTNTLFFSGLPLGFSLPAEVEIRPTQAFTLDLLDSSGDDLLPPTLATLAQNLRAQAEASDGFPDSSHLEQLLIPDFQLLNVELGENKGGPRLLRVIVAPKEAALDDIVSIRKEGPHLLIPRQSYEATWAQPTATPSELRQADAEASAYLPWLLQRYLQLPPTLPERVAALAQELTQGAATSYDKARAIENYLLTLTYRRDISPPPPNADGVDYFLFVQPEGYCEQFASAMVVMLRTVGVPARFAIGYASGDWDKKLEAYIVRERHYHAWVQVYFPDYGWVDFDPTPPSSSFDDDEGGFSGDWELLRPAGKLEAPQETASSSGPSLFTPKNLGIGLPLAIAVLLIWAWLRWVRVPPQYNISQQTYARMCRLAALARMGPQPQQTPEEFAQRLAQAIPAQSTHIFNIAQTYGKFRYAENKALTFWEREELKESWRILGLQLSRLIFLPKRQRSPRVGSDGGH